MDDRNSPTASDSSIGLRQQHGARHCAAQGVILLQKCAPVPRLHRQPSAPSKQGELLVVQRRRRQIVQHAPRTPRVCPCTYATASSFGECTRDDLLLCHPAHCTARMRSRSDSRTAQTASPRRPRSMRRGQVGKQGFVRCLPAVKSPVLHQRAAYSSGTHLDRYTVRMHRPRCRLRHGRSLPMSRGNDAARRS